MRVKREERGKEVRGQTEVPLPSFSAPNKEFMIMFCPSSASVVAFQLLDALRHLWNAQAIFLCILNLLVCLPAATWVGGGFILGIAEATYNPTLGAVWALMPVPYVVTFFLGKKQPLSFEAGTINHKP